MRSLTPGELQLAAIGVAVGTRPGVLLADEPTSQLDRATGEIVLELMLRAREERGTALVVVTHDREVSARLDVEHAIADGRLTTPARTGDGRG